MHEHLSCTLSRLSSFEPIAIVRVSECLRGLHPIHLYWFRTRMTDVPFAVSSNASADGSKRHRTGELISCPELGELRTPLKALRNQLTQVMLSIRSLDNCCVALDVGAIGRRDITQ